MGTCINTDFRGNFGIEGWVQDESSHFWAKFHFIHVPEKFSLLDFSFFMFFLLQNHRIKWVRRSPQGSFSPASDPAQDPSQGSQQVSESTQFWAYLLLIFEEFYSFTLLEGLFDGFYFVAFIFLLVPLFLPVFSRALDIDHYTLFYIKPESYVQTVKLAISQVLCLFYIIKLLGKLPEYQWGLSRLTATARVAGQNWL